MAPALSIVVPTRNRAGKLDALLRALAALEVPAGGLEAFVVDNGSTDETPQVLAWWAPRFPFPLRPLAEPRPGVSRARNAGVAAASAPIVAFLDDDCLPEPDWAAAILAAFAADARLAAVGGRVELKSPEDAPIGLRLGRERERMTGMWGAFGLLIGANAAYRRDVLAAAGGFDARLGPGTGIPAAEDSDLIWRVFLTGRPLVYEPGVLVRHDHGRKPGAGEALRIRRNYVVGRGAFYAKHGLKGDGQVLRQAYYEVRKLLAGAFKGTAAERSKARQNLGWLAAGAWRWLGVAFRAPG